MKYPKILGVVLMLAVVLSACSTAATPTSAPIHTLPPLATETSDTSTAGIPETGGSGTPSTGGLETATPSVSTTGTAGGTGTGASCATVTVQLHSAAGGTSMGGTTSGTGTPSAVMGTSTPSTGAGTSTSGGTTVNASDFLVDCNGHALYVTTDDTPNSGSSSCNDACADEWQPLTVSDGTTPTGGTGVDESLLSTITRDDGTVQVTYNGWPLYLYSADSSSTDMKGVGLEGKWFLIGADGNPIQQ